MRISFLPLLLLVVPLAEIATFVVVGGQIGVLPTIGLVILTTIVGMFLLRIQGLGALRRIQAVMNRGESPGRDLVHGLMIMVAGVLLLIPGFITDTIGLLLFVPAIRDAGWNVLRSRIRVVSIRPGDGPRPNRYGEGPTIDLDEDDYSSQSPHKRAGDDDLRKLDR